MCSITCLLSKSSHPELRKRRASEMAALSRHRGPDFSADFHDEILSMVHHRLSIIDTGERANQPLFFQDLALAFNGCIYNYRELKSELQQRGHRFETESDTEVFLHAFAEWGTKCYARFNGMWAAVIYDRRRKEIHLSRDYFGIKPLYLFRSNEMLAVASEAKQLLSFSEREEDVRGLYEYFTSGRQETNGYSWYKDIEVVPQGSFMVFDVGTMEGEFTSFYRVPNLSDVPSEERIRELISDAVKLRLRADVPIGINLSGGIDSGILASYLGSERSEVKQAFTSGFEAWKWDESPLAYQIAQKNRILHTVVHSAWKKMCDSLGKMSFLHDGPLSSYATFCSHELYSVIREMDIKVSLNGQGADELFAGYDAFHLRYIKHLLIQKPLRGALELLAAMLYRQGYSQYFNRIFKRGSKPESWLEKPEEPEEYKTWANFSFLAELGLNSLYRRGISGMLKSVDRNSMASGVECRVPFLDHRLVELALNLPDNSKVRMGVRKHILRKLYADQLPKAVLKKKRKQGYSSPQNLYLKENLSHILSEIRDASYTLPPLIVKEQLFQKLQKGNDLQLLWRVWAWVRWKDFQKQNGF